MAVENWLVGWFFCELLCVINRSTAGRTGGMSWGPYRLRTQRPTAVGNPPSRTSPGPSTNSTNPKRLYPPCSRSRCSTACSPCSSGSTQFAASSSSSCMKLFSAAVIAGPLSGRLAARLVRRRLARRRAGAAAEPLADSTHRSAPGAHAGRPCPAGGTAALPRPGAAAGPCPSPGDGRGGRAHHLPPDATRLAIHLLGR